VRGISCIGGGCLEIRKNINILIFTTVNSTLLAILEFIYGSKHVSNILFLTVRSKAIDCVFQIFRIYVNCLHVNRQYEALCTRRQ